MIWGWGEYTYLISCLLCRTFNLKVNLPDEGGGSSYNKPTLRGPPVQGLHETSLLISCGSRTQPFPGKSTV